MLVRVEVQCQKAEERPLRFAVNNREYLVDEVLDHWYGPEHTFFKLRADDGNVYILRHQTSAAHADWELVSFRQNR